jgi:hypothetical protein
MGLDNGLARTPPMAWMSWSKFFCEIDCEKHPRSCINEQLYKVRNNGKILFLRRKKFIIPII